AGGEGHGALRNADDPGEKSDERRVGLTVDRRRRERDLQHAVVDADDGRPARAGLRVDGHEGRVAVRGEDRADGVPDGRGYRNSSEMESPSWMRRRALAKISATDRTR